MSGEISSETSGIAQIVASLAVGRRFGVQDPARCHSIVICHPTPDTYELWASTPASWSMDEDPDGVMSWHYKSHGHIAPRVYVASEVAQLVADYVDAVESLRARLRPPRRRRWRLTRGWLS